MKGVFTFFIGEWDEGNLTGNKCWLVGQRKQEWLDILLENDDRFRTLGVDGDKQSSVSRQDPSWL